MPLKIGFARKKIRPYDLDYHGASRLPGIEIWWSTGVDETAFQKYSEGNITILRRGTEVSSQLSGPKSQIFRIHLLGRMNILGTDGEDIFLSAKKTKALLAYLCLARGERVFRTKLAGLLWDRSPEKQARDHLRHALSDLHHVSGSWRLERERHWVRLDTTACWIDVFENPDRPDLLDDLNDVSPAFDQWLLEARSRYEAGCQLSLEAKLNDLVAQQAPPVARIDAARKLLNFAPHHQRAIRSLMIGLVDSGDPAQVLQEYERFEALLAASHSMRPSEKTTALYKKIRREWQIAPAPNGTPRKPDQAISHPDHAVDSGSGAQTLQPSIAVLPFRDLSAKLGRNYVAEGLTEDLVETLSRVPGLFVISRLSAAAFKKQDKSPQEIGEALRVRYILSGSLRLIGDRLRLNVELTEANTGGTVWVERFDRQVCDVLDVQDQLAETAVRALAPHVRFAELKRLRATRPEQQGAYQLLLRAQERMLDPSRQAFEAAEQLFEQAIERAPDYAPALTWRAYWHVMRVGQEWSLCPERDTAQAEHFAKLACECDPADPMAIAVQGHVSGYLHKDFKKAFSFFETALEINPNSSRAWLWNSNAHAWTGEGTEAVAKVKRATALSPFDPMRCAYSGGAAIAHLADGQYARAAEFASRCIRDNPTYTTGHKLLIIALALEGREDEARTAVGPMLSLEPSFTVERYRHRFPGSEGPLADAFCDALARAGVPRST